jgi:hypothetical protein
MNLPRHLHLKTRLESGEATTEKKTLLPMAQAMMMSKVVMVVLSVEEPLLMSTCQQTDRNLHSHLLLGLWISLLYLLTCEEGLEW